MRDVVVVVVVLRNKKEEEEEMRCACVAPLDARTKRLWQSQRVVLRVSAPSATTFFFVTS